MSLDLEFNGIFRFKFTKIASEYAKIGHFGREFFKKCLFKWNIILFSPV